MSEEEEDLEEILKTYFKKEWLCLSNNSGINIITKITNSIGDFSKITNIIQKSLILLVIFQKSPIE